MANSKQKILIIGGVAGGASCATRLRRLSEEAEIILFERGEYVSFANCGLPYYIGGVIENRNSLLVQSVESLSKRFNLDVRNNNEVLKINPEAKTVEVKNLKNDEIYTESYDKLVLSPGAEPLKPNISGIKEAQNIFTLRNIPDTDKIKNFITKNNVKKAVVVGGGFIGVEMVENLKHLGLEVALVEKQKHIMTTLDYEMACILHNHLKEKGVNLILENGVKEFKNQGKTLVLENSEEIETDLTILSIGIKPETKLAKEAGLKIGNLGGIETNDFMQTSDENIYAIGDAVQIKNFVTGNQTLTPLASPANRQGRLVADNIILGQKTKYKGALGVAIAKIFNLSAGSCGYTEKCLQNINQEYQVLHLHPGSHAGYYPEATPISLKIIFNPKNHFILGAQAVGRQGVDKRIDVIATAIKGGLTVYDLTDLELSYAPPFSSAKDPVNMAGYVATNILEDKVKMLQWDEIEDFQNQGNIVLDVRQPEELAMGKIENSINIPLNTIRDNLNQLEKYKNKTICTYCQVGLRGYIAYRILEQNDFDVVNLDGGFKTYIEVFKPNKAKESKNLEIKDSGEIVLK